MITLMKNDFKLLRWSKIYKTSIISVLLIILFNFLPSAIVIMGFKGKGVGDGFGFVFRHYSDTPTFAEAMVSSLANTVLIWILILMIITSFTVKDVLNAKQISAVANGYKPCTLFISKIIVSIIFISLLYYICILSCLAINLMIVGVKFTIEEFIYGLLIISMNNIILNSFVIACSTLCIVLKSSQYIHIISFIYFFGGAFYVMISYMKGNIDNILYKIIAYTNYFVCTMFVSSYNMESNIKYLIFIIISIILSYCISNYLLKSRDYD